MIARSGSGFRLVLSTWYLVLGPSLVLGPWSADPQWASGLD